MSSLSAFCFLLLHSHLWQYSHWNCIDNFIWAKPFFRNSHYDIGVTYLQRSLEDCGSWAPQLQETHHCRNPGHETDVAFSLSPQPHPTTHATTQATSIYFCNHSMSSLHYKQYKNQMWTCHNLKIHTSSTVQNQKQNKVKQWLHFWDLMIYINRLCNIHRQVWQHPFLMVIF